MEYDVNILLERYEVENEDDFDIKVGNLKYDMSYEYDISSVEIIDINFLNHCHDGEGNYYNIKIGFKIETEEIITNIDELEDFIVNSCVDILGDSPENITIEENK